MNPSFSCFNFISCLFSWSKLSNNINSQFLEGSHCLQSVRVNVSTYSSSRTKLYIFYSRHLLHSRFEYVVYFCMCFEYAFLMHCFPMTLIPIKVWPLLYICCLEWMGQSDNSEKQLKNCHRHTGDGKTFSSHESHLLSSFTKVSAFWFQFVSFILVEPGTKTVLFTKCIWDQYLCCLDIGLECNPIK